MENEKTVYTAIYEIRDLMDKYGNLNTKQGDLVYDELEKALKFIKKENNLK